MRNMKNRFLALVTGASLFLSSGCGNVDNKIETHSRAISHIKDVDGDGLPDIVFGVKYGDVYVFYKKNLGGTNYAEPTFLHKESGNRFLEDYDFPIEYAWKGTRWAAQNERSKYLLRLIEDVDQNKK